MSVLENPGMFIFMYLGMSVLEYLGNRYVCIRVSRF